MRNLVGSALVLGLLAASVLAGYYRHQAGDYRRKLAASEDRTRQAQPAPGTVNATEKAGSGASAPAVVVRQSAGESDDRIRQLEEALHSKDALILSLQQAKTNTPAAAPRRGQAWLEHFQQTNPQQYAAMTNRREQVRQAVEASFAERAEYFRDYDPSTLNTEDQARYQRINQLLNETWRLSEQLRADPTSGDRRTVMQAMRQNMRELEPMLATERSKEFYNLGLQLGYSGNDSQLLGDYLNKIIDMTSMQSIYHSMRSGMFPDRRPRPDNAPSPAR